jgi:RNA polymerase sigma factor (sigma-70 family)
MEEWVVALDRGAPDEAWDLCLARYRRVIFAAIRHYVRDEDDVMDVFARVCESLRADDLRRLRAWASETAHRARFSTWLVTVVRHLAVDWYREQHGRRRISALEQALPPLQRLIFEQVFLRRRSHAEAYEVIRAGTEPALGFREFLVALRETYRAAAAGRRTHAIAEMAPGLEPPDGESEPQWSVTHGRQLTEAMASLAPEDRLLLQFYLIDELPAREVARMLGMPNAKAVYNRTYRLLADLRVDLERRGFTPEDR